MATNAIEKATPVWPSFIRDEFEANQNNGQVGTRLLSETDRVRVWEIRLAPGERIGFHRHVLDYFWTAVTPWTGAVAYGRWLRGRGDLRGRRHASFRLW
jgi:beta-alanine degradation protein BauB